jgi:hypothetical protein
MKNIFLKSIVFSLAITSSLSLLLTNPKKTYAGCCVGNECVQSKVCGTCGPYECSDNWTCFPAGTQVEMADKTQKNIENVQIGDRVISQSEEGVKSEATVTALDQPIRDHMCQVSFTDGQSLRLTDEHPLFTKEGWKSIEPENTYKDNPNLPVTGLQKGDKVVKSNGVEAEVDYFGCWSEKIQTYNLILDGQNRTYFANGYLAHNKSGAEQCGGITITVDTLTPVVYPDYPTYATLSWTVNISGENADDVWLFVSTNPDAVTHECGISTPIRTVNDWNYFNQCVRLGSQDPNGLLAGSARSYTIPNLAPGTVYYWEVRVVANNCWNTQQGDAFMTTSNTTPTPVPTTPPTPTPTPAPSCSVNLSPSTTTIPIPTSGLLTANVTTSNGSVSSVSFSSNSSRVSVSPSSDSSSPYQTRATAVSPGNATITSNVYMGGVLRCTDTSAVTVPTPGCTVSLTPVSANIEEGSSRTFGASVNASNGSIDRVEFSSSNSSVASVNPSSDSSPSYSTVVTGVNNNINPVTITARVIMAGSQRCSDTSSVTVIPPIVDPWWQVIDGDVTSNGNIRSLVYGSSEYFDENRAGGYPGVPIYSGVLSVNNRISARSWNANTSTSIDRIYDYLHFRNLVPSDITFSNPATTSMSTGGTQQYGYYWFRASGNYTISSNLNLGSRKVILFVDGGNLNINARVNLNDGSGFFGAFVDGGITVGSGVTGTPAIEGMFVSDGQFSTSGSSPLYIRGSVASLSGFSLNRDLTDNRVPAEVFEYAPDQVLLFPPKLAAKKTRWSEIAP